MNKRIVLIGAAIVLIALIAIVVWQYTGSQKTIFSEPDEISVAYSPYESGALFWIAYDRGFFRENGLNLSLRKYDSGAASLEAVVNGEADISVGASEFPLVRHAFRNTSLRVLGNMDKGDFVYLVARKDRIGNISGLRGKRVGTARGTVAEFHLGRFLILHGMSLDDITLVDVRTPAGWVGDVADGKIDAIVVAQPYASAAQDRLGDNAVIMPVQSRQPVSGLVLTSEDWIARHPGAGVRFIRSLAQAVEYLDTHPAEARAIVRKELDFDFGYMDTVWRQNQYSLTLDQSLVLSMEDEARWMIANNLTNATAVPEFRRYLYTDGLKTVRPGSVNIIGGSP